MTAEHAYVLTPTDVRNIRNYVLSKYAAMPGKRQAEIVADAVSRVIHRQLPDFDAAIKHRLTNHLIRTTVLEEKKPVRADDIYQLCMELDQEDERIRQPFHRWIREQESHCSLGLKAEAHHGAILGEAGNADVVPSRLPDGHVRRMRKRLLVYGLLSLLIIVSSSLYAGTSSTSMQPGTASFMKMPMPLPRMELMPPPAPLIGLNELPVELQYTEVDRERLISYLRGRDSLLANEPYFDAIMGTARDFDIHPALLFAITGQEQAFVPASHKNAKEIANNPFNVFHSWREFNTTIEQSAAIAARTINRLSKDRPSEVDPIVWINREYAEDPNWSKGVASIFRDVITSVGDSRPSANK